MATDPELKRSFRGHKEAISGVAFNPNTKQIASSSLDSTVTVWNFKPEQRPFRFAGHKGPVYDIAFSPNGQVLASASKDETVRLWQNCVEGYSTTIKAHTGPVRSVTFSSEGKMLLSTSDDKTAKVWNAYDKKLLFNLVGHNRAVLAARFSPDNRLIASGSDDKTVKVWDVGHRQELYTFCDHGAAVTTVKFHPDGACMASASRDKKIKIYDIRSKTLLQHYDAHAGGINEVAFHPSGNFLVSGSDDSKIKIWDLRMGKLSYTLYGHGGECTSIDFSAEGDYFGSGGTDRVVMVWKSNFEQVCLEHIEDIIEPKNTMSYRKSPAPQSAKKYSVTHSRMDSPKGKMLLFSPKSKGTASPVHKPRGKVGQVTSFQARTQSEKKNVNQVSVRKHRQIAHTSTDFSQQKEYKEAPKANTTKLSDVLSTSLDKIGSQLATITKSIKVLENKLEANEEHIAQLMHVNSPSKQGSRSESKDYGISFKVGNDYAYSVPSHKYSATKIQYRYDADNDENYEILKSHGK